MDDHDQATTEDCVSCQTNRLGAEDQSTLDADLAAACGRGGVQVRFHFPAARGVFSSRLGQ